MKVEHIITLCSRLYSRQTVIKERLAEELQVSPRTVRRYIANLRQYDIAVEEHRTGEETYLKLPSDGKRPLRLDEFEAISLHVALTTLRTFEDDVLSRNLEKIHDQLRGLLATSRASAPRARTASSTRSRFCRSATRRPAPTNRSF